MKVLDDNTTLSAPPSDKKLNNIAFALSVIVCSILACYFFFFSLAVSIHGFRPLFVFAYLIFPPVLIMIIAGAFICITQLMRNIYYKILISGVLLIVGLIALIAFIIIVAVFQGDILLPFIYRSK